MRAAKAKERTIGLVEAAQKGDAKAVAAWIEREGESLRGSEDALAAVDAAAGRGRAQCLGILLRVLDGRRGPEELTPLMRAAEAKSPACVRLLLPCSDPKARGPEGMTALMCAARAGSVSCARLLLPVSDELATDDDGKNALAWAVGNSQIECVRLLASRSAAAQPDAAGRDALIVAAGLAREKARKALVEILLPVSNPSARDCFQWTALMHACVMDDRRCVELLAPRSDLGAKSQAGTTARGLAIDSGSNESLAAIDHWIGLREAKEERESLLAAVSSGPDVAPFAEKEPERLADPDRAALRI
jgi:hypothetical protein